jgi:hypothetical protein
MFSIAVIRVVPGYTCTGQTPVIDDGDEHKNMKFEAYLATSNYNAGW